MTTYSYQIVPRHRWGNGNLCWSSCTEVGKTDAGEPIYRCERGHVFGGSRETEETRDG